MRDSFISISNCKWFGLHGPSERLGHGAIEVGDEVLDFGAQILFAGEIASADDLSRQDGEPDLDLVKPRGVPGSEVKGDAMPRLAQEGRAGRLGLEDAGLALGAKLALELAMVSDDPNDGLREMDIEIVADDVPTGVWGGAAQQSAEKPLADSSSVTSTID